MGVTAVDLYTEVLLDFCAKTAATYDEWAGGVNRKAAEHLAALAAVEPDEAVIDAGCGTGLVSRALTLDRGAGGRALAVDLSQTMLDVAAAKRPPGAPITYTLGAVEDLIVPDGSVDVVLLGQVLAYTADPEAVLLEARRVLRPGGRVAVSGLQRSLMTAIDSAFIAELVDLGATFRIPRRGDEHALLGEPDVLRGLLEEAGFTMARTSSMVVGDHTADAHSFIELMRDEGPWPHAMVALLRPRERERLERRLTGTARFAREEGFAYHRPFSFAVAWRV